MGQVVLALKTRELFVGNITKIITECCECVKRTTNCERSERTKSVCLVGNVTSPFHPTRYKYVINTLSPFPSLDGKMGDELAQLFEFASGTKMASSTYSQTMR